jgi:myo-inositol-1(or 4)-monophosphatase
MPDRGEHHEDRLGRWAIEIVIGILAAIFAPRIQERFALTSVVLDIAVAALWRLIVVLAAFRLQQWLMRWPKVRRAALWILLAGASGVLLSNASGVALAGEEIPTFRIMDGIAALLLQAAAGYLLLARRPPRTGIDIATADSGAKKTAEAQPLASVGGGIDFESLKTKNMPPPLRDRVWGDTGDVPADFLQEAFDAIINAFAAVSVIFLQPYKDGRFRLPNGQRESAEYNDFRSTILLDHVIDDLIRRHLQIPALFHVGWESDIRKVGDSKSGYSWVVDPIDGCRHLARDLPLFASTVALTHLGIPVLSVIYIPLTGELFFAIKGRGAYLNSWNAPQRVSDIGVRDAIVYVEFPNRDLAEHDNVEFESECRVLTQVFRTVKRVRGFGLASIGLAYVAKGTFDAYLTLPGTTLKSDIVAGQLLVKEAGGEVYPVEAHVKGAKGVRVFASNTRLNTDLGGILGRTYHA